MGADGTALHSALSPDIEIGIVGAGAMGAGIAQVAAIAGHPIRIVDVRKDTADAAIASIRANIGKLVAKGRLTAEDGAAAQCALHPASTVADLAACGLVVEAIVEDLTAKRALFRQIEAVVTADALLATNTSSLSITAIGAELQHPERLAGLHFFNPATVMLLVEVISGAATAVWIAQTLYATVSRWGKVPVLARSSPGFIVNRVARPFYAEALRVLNEGTAEPATLDAIVRESGGFRMGPCELMDLIGHDVNYAVTRSVFNAFYGDPRFTPSVLQFELVQAGYLGRKTGRGFYDYSENAPGVLADTHPPVSAPGRVRLFGQNDLVERLALAKIPAERLGKHVDGRIAACESCVLYRSDGRTATARAASTGVQNTIVIDLVLDAATFTRAAIAPADQCERAAVLDAVGLLQAAGLAVSVIGDIPGMIVLRTVAMLANEAADAVNQGVCSASDCDLAMRKGVNYPRGPLEWAEYLGLSRVVEVLDNIAKAYGEDRYRVSPLLRRKALAGGHFLDRRDARNV